jgi:transposase
LFKYEKLVRDYKKEGLDFVWYAFRVYESCLFLYYIELRRINQGKDVYIIEDNISVHHKARWLLADQIHELNIQFLNIPANSPDLQPIKHLHKDQKKELSSARFNTTSATAAVQKEREREMITIWQQSETFENTVKECMAIDYWKGLATRAMHADPPYSNRYKDSL